MIRRVVTCLVLVVAAQAAFADVLEVFVYQKGTGDPVEGAQLVVPATGALAESDSKGRALFAAVNFPVDVKIVQLGYTGLQQLIAGSPARVYLEPLEVSGSAVEVVADRVTERTSKVVMSREEARKTPGTGGDPLRAITSLPGIVQAGGQGQGPGFAYFRGSDGLDNAFLANNLPLDYVFHAGSITGNSVFNPDLIEDFNVFLGGFPAQYPEVMGGIVDVKLRAPKNDRLHQIYRVGINEAAFLVEGPIGDKESGTSFYAAARKSYLDFFPIEKVINKRLEKNESAPTITTFPRYFDAQGRLRHEFASVTLDLNYFAAGDELAIVTRNKKDVDPALEGTFGLKHGYQVVGGSLTTKNSETTRYDLNFGLRNYYERIQVGQDLQGNPFFADDEFWVGVIEPRVVTQLSENDSFNAGAKAEVGRYPIDLYINGVPTENKVDRNFTLDQKYRVNSTLKTASIAPYFTYSRRRGPFSSNLGLRYLTGGASGGIRLSGAMPRASAEYELNPEWSVHANWGRYLQLPTPPGVLLPGFGNPDLPMQKAEHRIVGVRYKPNAQWSVLAETYYKPMVSLINSVPGQLPPNNYAASGEGKAYGFDLLVKRDYAERKMGWLSYSYGRSKRRDSTTGDDRSFVGDQPHTINAVWSQPFHGEYSQWSWGVKAHLHTGTPYTPTIGRAAYCVQNGGYYRCANQAAGSGNADFSHWVPVRAGQNSERLPAFYQIDARFDREFRFNTWTLSVYLDITNVTAAQNVIGYDYGRAYEKTANPGKVTSLPIPLPFFGIEARI